MRLYFHPYISRLGVDRAAVETSAWGRTEPDITGTERPKVDIVLSQLQVFSRSSGLWAIQRRHDPSGNSTCRWAAAKATFSPSLSSGMQ